MTDEYEIIGEQMLDEEDKALVDEIYSRVMIFEDSAREYHDSAREARKIVRMRDPHQDEGLNPEDEKTLQLDTL